MEGKHRVSKVRWDLQVQESDDLSTTQCTVYTVVRSRSRWDEKMENGAQRSDNYCSVRSEWSVGSSLEERARLTRHPVDLFGLGPSPATIQSESVDAVSRARPLMHGSMPSHQLHRSFRVEDVIRSSTGRILGQVEEEGGSDTCGGSKDSEAKEPWAWREQKMIADGLCDEEDRDESR